jgi:cytochrome c oxidase subunit II
VAHPVKRARAVAARLLAVSASAALLGACGSGSSPSMLDPKGSESRDIAGVWWLMFAIACGVYLVVGGLIVYAILRRPAAPGDGEVEPSRRFDDRMVAWGGVVLPVIVLLVLAFVTIHTTNALRRPERNALRVDVVGKRWFWAVTYPAAHFTTANEVRLPAGRPVEIRLTTGDVIHSFWVPQLAGKVDTIPGQVNTLRFVPRTPGTYRGMCAEFCGLQHAHMGFVVRVDTAGVFDRWMAQHSRPALEPASEAAAEGEAVFDSQPCAGCHTVAGTPAQGTIGPDLSDLGERPTLGAGLLENTPANLARWITDAPGVKPGILMPSLQLSSRDVQAIVAYLESLK